MKIVGISGPPRDSAACLVVDGIVRAAAQEERFSRASHDGALPVAALAYCLEAAQVDSAAEIDVVVFHRAAHAEWLRAVVPEFAGHVLQSCEDESRWWGHRAPSEAAAAIAAALAGWQAQTGELPVTSERAVDAALGPAYTSSEVRDLFERFDFPYHRLEPSDAARAIARLAAGGHVVGIVRDRMEFGGISLGNRSIVAAGERPDARARLAAVTDDDSVIETVSAAHDGAFVACIRAALDAIDASTPLVHAPFMTAGEPTVCSPLDAYRCMMRGGIDAVVMEDVLLWRREQPPWRHGAGEP